MKSKPGLILLFGRPSFGFGRSDWRFCRRPCWRRCLPEKSIEYGQITIHRRTGVIAQILFERA